MEKLRLKKLLYESYLDGKNDLPEFRFLQKLKGILKEEDKINKMEVLRNGKHRFK